MFNIFIALYLTINATILYISKNEDLAILYILVAILYLKEFENDRH